MTTMNRVWASTLIAALAACAVPSSPSPIAPTTGKASSNVRECVLGRQLSSEETAERNKTWEQIEASRRQASAGEGSEACTLVRNFHKECPRWDINTPNAVAELCQERGHEACVAGTKLDAQTRRDRAIKWARVMAVKARPEGNGSLHVACGFAQDFAANCPAWDPNAKTIATEICTVAGKDCAPGMDASAKKASAPIIRPEIEGALRRDLGLPGMKDPNDAKKAIAATRSQMNLYKCYDPEGAPALEAQVDKWAEATEAAIVEEINCRASDACMARRIALNICATIADKREAAQMIAAERRNPGGVVDLHRLHGLGERIQVDDATIARLKTEYAGRSGGKAFGEALCQAQR